MKLTKLIVVGARCEACSKQGAFAASFEGQVRYYCVDHIGLALRPLGIECVR